MIAMVRKTAELQVRQGQSKAAWRLRSSADRLQANYLAGDASRLLQKGRYDEADRCCAEPVAVDQSSPLAHWQLVATLRCTGDLTDAAEACIANGG